MQRRAIFRSCALACALSVLPVVSSVSWAETRLWKSKSGARTVEGEFVELKDGRLTLRKSDGTTFGLPLAALIADDQVVASEAQARIDAENAVDVLGVLKGNLLRMVEGKPQPYAGAANPAPTHVLFYVVSSLCESCQKHAPQLKAYYQETLAAAPEIELVVISLDAEREQQIEYLAGQQFAFPAVSLDAMPAFEKAIPSRIFDRAVDGCQTFILATADGRVLEKSPLVPKRAVARILGQSGAR